MRNDMRNADGLFVNTNSSGVDTYYPAIAFSDQCFSSGYTGRKPKPLVPHGFNYRVQRFSMRRNFIEEVFYRNGDYLRSSGAGPYISPIQPALAFLNVDDSSYNTALERLNEKVRGSLDLSVDLAESHQTRAMFNATKRIGDLHDLLRKKYGLLKLVGNAWLEFTYGIRPLVSTIYGVADNLIEAPNRVFATSYSGRASVKSIPDVQVMSVDGTYKTFKSDSVFKHATTIRLNLKGSDRFDIARWTSLNPISIAWELTPYSFVVDWVYDVGSYLRNLETGFAYGNRFLGGTISTLEATEGSLNWAEHTIRHDDYLNTISRSDTWTGSYFHRKFSRELLTSYPFPHPPKIDVKLGSSRLLSAAALLGQRLK